MHHIKTILLKSRAIGIHKNDKVHLPEREETSIRRRWGSN
jgi:hypothetical protein